MSNKNPFEIRTEVLQLAKEYMDQQTQLNLQYWEKMVDTGRATIKEAQSAYVPYTMEDLMKKAQEMYSFVSKKE